MSLKTIVCGMIALLVMNQVGRSADAPVNPFAGKPVAEIQKVLAGDKSEVVRIDAVNALAKVTPAGPEVINALVDALGDQACSVRAYAMKALGKAGEAAVPGLIKSLQSDNIDVRAYAAGALAEMTWCKATGLPPEVAAVPALTKALGDKDYSVRVAATRALGGIKTNAVSALPKLIELLKDKEWAVVDEAIKAVAAVDPGGRESVPALVKMLNSTKHDVKKYICTELMKLGPKAAEAIPSLIKQLDVGGVDWAVSKAAAEALVVIDPTGKQVVGPIAQGVAGHKRPFVKENLLYALSSLKIDLGPDVKPAIPFAIEQLKAIAGNPWGIPAPLMSFLQSAGAQAKGELVPVLKELLKAEKLNEQASRKPMEALLKKLEG